MKTILYTHADNFHADELLAIALLQLTLLSGKEVEIIRTRDLSELQAATTNSDVFVIDVGRQSDPAKLNFDHHQDTFKRAWPDGSPYSSCGLVWAWLRQRGALANFGTGPVLDWMEEVLVRPADRHDNGVGHWAPAGIIADYNRSHRDPVEGRAAFDRALGFAHELIANQRAKAQKDIEARDRMARALAEPIHAEQVVVIENGKSSRFPYWAARLGGSEVKLVISPYKREGWCLISTPKNLNDSFSASCRAPEAWRGLSQVEIAVEDGKVPLIFCHKAGHMTLVRGHLGNAMKVAKAILAEG